MSFSGKCKEELLKQPMQARHCAIAELAGILLSSGRLEKEEEELKFVLQTDNEQTVERVKLLLENVMNESSSEMVVPIQGRKSLYYVMSDKRESLYRLFGALKLEADGKNGMSINNIITQNTCCKRALIKGAFLASGSVSSPEKAYHLEIVLISRETADVIAEAINTFGMEAKIVARKKYYVVYLKEGSQISDMLSLMGAPVAMMEFENIRILKEVRNSVNRQVNCEMANLTKTVTAATKQVEDILFIKEHYGLNRLKPQLKQVAEARLENPDMPLKELGEILSPPVGKSGVNHRLKKLQEIAADLRGILPER